MEPVGVMRFDPMAGLSMGGLCRLSAVLAATALAVGGCSGEDTATASTTTGVPVPQVSIAQTGFCNQMIQIRVDALTTDDVVDPAASIDRYREALTQAPTAIRPDLEALIVQLEGTAPDTAPVDNEELDGEGWQPAADPASRVFEYVETHCSGVANNPGPAATPPP